MLEQDFNAALIDGAALPHHRFPIYRNNVAGALVGALKVRFPVVEQLVGVAFFRTMAGEYCAQNKPSSAVLIHYGATFAAFIAQYESAASLPYLAEVARFENAWWNTYHAADAQNFDAQQLEKIAADAWGDLTFQFQPSVQIFSSDQGAVSIWQWHQTTNNPEKLELGGSEYAIVSRTGFDVEVRMISAEGFCFLQSLKAGQSLAVAVETTQTKFPEFDLQQHLAALFQLNLIAGVST
jgi:Putative DNA-binding domain